MEVFRADGHLTDEALLLLIQEGVPEELTRLEIAEHLAFCGECLERYTGLLDAAPLLTPARSCERSLWARIRARAIQAFTSRYATAAAAVFIALTVVWGNPPMETVREVFPEDRPAITERIGETLSQAITELSDFLGGFRSHS